MLWIRENFKRREAQGDLSINVEIGKLTTDRAQETYAAERPKRSVKRIIVDNVMWSRICYRGTQTFSRTRQGNYAFHQMQFEFNFF
jgi:hypothetical protein